MLAQPYGYPSILSAYVFGCPSQNSMGPPSDGSGWTVSVTCAASLESAVPGEWVCEHRDPSIRNMVGFRRVVAGAGITHWMDNGANFIAFSRGDRGFVAINRESSAVAVTAASGMAPGTYCDRLTGGLVGAACAGTTVVVDSAGGVGLDLPPMSAIAIDVTTKM
jgi:alpha-amylase